jgi:type IV secretory pathway VirD2 relaxase
MACMAMNSACADYRRRAMVQLTRMQTKFKSFLDTRNDLVFVDMKLEHDD